MIKEFKAPVSDISTWDEAEIARIAKHLAQADEDYLIAFFENVKSIAWASAIKRAI